MKEPPQTPTASDAPAGLFEGHLWLLELVEGSLLRFQLQESGLIRFGGGTRTYQDFDAVPDPCRRAVRHVRESLDRQALRDAVDDVEALTFFGTATHLERLNYDWERLPPFVGSDVWSTASESFRPPDATAEIFDRLGLSPVNAFERERRGRDFDPENYEIPGSAWGDSPAAGVVIRNKRGGHGKIENPVIANRDPPTAIDADDAETLADVVATESRFERVTQRLQARGRSPTVEALQEGVLDDIYREEHGRLFTGPDPVQRKAFRGAVATRAQQFLGG